MDRKRQRRAVTLIEMIIVMILIATITGVLAVSYRGTLERGNAFKTEQRMRRLDAILTTYFMEHPEAAGTTNQFEEIIKLSPLAGENADDLLQDGWGKKFQIAVPPIDKDDWRISISSVALDKYKTKNDPRHVSSSRITP